MLPFSKYLNLFDDLKHLSVTNMQKSDLQLKKQTDKKERKKQDGDDQNSRFVYSNQSLSVFCIQSMIRCCYMCLLALKQTQLIIHVAVWHAGDTRDAVNYLEATEELVN